MHLPSPLVKAVLIRRYKRFLADATLATGEPVTAHVANPGAMLGLADPGLQIYLSKSRDPKRKLKYSWELADLGGGHWAGVSTQHPNRIVEEALRDGRIPELAAYASIRREVRYGENSRIDFLLSAPGLPDAYVEVKNVHLRRTDDWAEFPDARTARGAKHLRELAAMSGQGSRAVMLYLVQRTDCRRFRLAADIDPSYFEAYTAAREHGVEAIAYDCRITPPGDSLGGDGVASVTLAKPVPIDHGASARDAAMAKNATG